MQSCSQVYCLRQLAGVLQRYSLASACRVAPPPTLEKAKLWGINPRTLKRTYASLYYLAATHSDPFHIQFPSSLKYRAS